MIHPMRFVGGRLGCEGERGAVDPCTLMNLTCIYTSIQLTPPRQWCEAMLTGGAPLFMGAHSCLVTPLAPCDSYVHLQRAAAAAGYTLLILGCILLGVARGAMRQRHSIPVIVDAQIDKQMII